MAYKTPEQMLDIILSENLLTDNLYKTSYQKKRIRNRSPVIQGS